ncbi:alanine racemase [Clostridium sp. A1-XYC3]|uniref:Alanine racemase n=1 Tax=Clostridium tanneri TaxID=3037988 RepID=A0ABU4JPP8_9CLOT|nr:alanine racemase [Clostridium sp. A1-XYC3]MDW8800095.1 alanine racemase [Clostridium sp. A1-XYC3]
MFNNFRPVWAEISLDNIAYNIQQIRKLAKSKELIAVVKADAYGHGAIDIAPVVLENGATRLAVAVISEAVELRKSGINCPIMILGLTPGTLTEELLEYNLEPTVSSYDYALSLSEAGKSKNKIVKIHIAVDTGMGRIGFLPCEESIEEIHKISNLPNIEVEGLFSHFCTADETDKEYSKMQFSKYNWFCEKIKERNIKINMRDIANSAAIMELPDTHYDGTRPGIILYGYYPSSEVNKDILSIKPALTWKANIMHIKTLDKDEYIGYGRKFRTTRKSVIATLPVGYADGYTRMMSGKAKVIINGKFAPVVGNICMDQCMIDITDIEGVNVGDEVILLGTDGNIKFDADDIAPMLGTINYEVICMVSKRVPRVYIKEGQVVKVRNYV